MARPGPMRTEAIDVPRPADPTQPWDLELRLVAARAQVSSQDGGLLQGTIAYNLAGLKPSFEAAGRRVRIRQDFQGRLPDEARNEWRLRLGRGVPLHLRVFSGASRGEWDLGGLSLRRLDWFQGAAAAELTFSEPNPERLERCRINGGTAALTVKGLANAGFDQAHVNAGLGALTLVCDGRLSRDAEVVLTGGLSSITLRSGGNPVRLTLEGALKFVSNTSWRRSGRVYESPEWAGAGGPRLHVRARVGLAALELAAGS